MTPADQFARASVRNLLSVLPVGVIAVDSSGVTAWWEGNVEEMLGWSRNEVIGAAPPLPIRSNGGSLRCQRKSGEWLDLKSSVIPWVDDAGVEKGILVILERLPSSGGVTTSPVSYEHLRFRDLLEAAADAIIEVDEQGRIILLNRVTEQMFGYTRAELLNQPVEVLIPSDLRIAHRQHRTRYWSHPSTRPMGTSLKLEGQRKDGSTFPVEISLSPVKGEGNVRVSAIIRDVSERKRAEEQLRTVQESYTQELTAKNQELAARNELVERADRLKSEFLSGMSHELRTPLHTIIGFGELLEEELEGPLNEKQHRFVQHILKDSQHLLALINDVLDLSKIESGRLDLRPEYFALADAIEETVSSVRPRAEAKRIILEIVTSAAIDIYADRLRIKQILYNLLSNAVKFTPEGGSVSVDVELLELAVRISVTDTGIGIAQAEHDSVFDKFYQVGQRQAGGHEGTGLGLAITRHLIEQHGGTIRLQSEVGKGSRFTIEMPLGDVRADEP